MAIAARHHRFQFEDGHHGQASAPAAAVAAVTAPSSTVQGAAARQGRSEAALVRAPNGVSSRRNELIWLVVWNNVFAIYWEFHHPN